VAWHGNGTLAGAVIAAEAASAGAVVANTAAAADAASREPIRLKFPPYVVRALLTVGSIAMTGFTARGNVRRNSQCDYKKPPSTS
jgi:hypothetical protein